MQRAVRLFVSILWFYVGLAITVLGYALVVKPGLGASPWDIFHLGAAARTGWAIAVVINLTGLLIVLFNWLMGIPPTLGMLLNMLSVGPFMQIWLSVLPTPTGLPARWVTVILGILISGLGTGLYVSAGIGSGPRDGMMIGLAKRLGKPVGMIKNGIDITVALAGWLLGGPIGLATVAVALGLGPAMQMGISAVNRLAGLAAFSTFIKPVPVRRAS